MPDPKQDENTPEEPKTATVAAETQDEATLSDDELDDVAGAGIEYDLSAGGGGG